MNFNNQESSGYNHSEASRKGDMAIRIGTIEEVRFDVKGAPKGDDEGKPNWTCEDKQGNFRGAQYRVKFGDGQTYWMPKLNLRAGNDQEYWAFEKGEQVVVVCVGGDPMQSFLIGSVYQDKFRPPVGIDDKTNDKRPWRETVHRIHYQDGCIWEYDRKLHREIVKYPDGATYTYWFQDPREQREKETDSDITGVPPRHFEQRQHPDNHSYLYIWDENEQHHVKREVMSDGTVFEFHYDDAGAVKKHTFAYSDGGLIEYDLKEHTLTLKAEKIILAGQVSYSGFTGDKGMMIMKGDMMIEGKILDTEGNTNHHSH